MGCRERGTRNKGHTTLPPNCNTNTQRIQAVSQTRQYYHHPGSGAGAFAGGGANAKL